MEVTSDLLASTSQKSFSTESGSTSSPLSRSSYTQSRESLIPEASSALQNEKPDSSGQGQEDSLNSTQVYFSGLYLQNPSQVFTDSQGNYIGKIGDHIAYRYEILSYIGKGAFAQVFECLDHKSQETVAIKVLNKKPLLSNSGKKESRLLDTLNKSDKSTQMLIKKLSFEFRGHFFIVFERLSYNLYQVIKQSHFKGIGIDSVKTVARDILNSLNIVHSLGFIHCDLKPENLMTSNGQHWKIIDFGSACSTSEELEEYVQSRAYRAPEVVLGCRYNEKVDIWSLGCVLFECFKGTPLFPAEDERDLLLMIQNTVGKINQEFLMRTQLRNVYFRNGVVQGQQWRNKSLSTLLGSDNQLFIDFITKCLKWDPEERISVESALDHPWLNS